MSRIENGIEIVLWQDVAEGFERVAANAWVNPTPEQSATQDPLPRPPSHNPSRRLEEVRGQTSHWKSYLEVVGTAASFASLHVVSQRLIGGNEGIFLFAGVIIALPIIKETAPSVIRRAIRFFKR